MEICISTRGQARLVYNEAFDLSQLGSPSISRASHVEPDARGCWWADLAAVSGPQLGPFQFRSQALAAEQDWLQVNLPALAAAV